jgi:hypothetical protein
MPGRLLCRGALVAFALLPSTSGCESPTGACTSIGCASGLMVHLDELPSAPFRLELSALIPDEQPLYRYDCPEGAAACAQDIFFAGLIAPRVWARITTPAGSVLHEIINHDYVEHRLNGPGCGVTCRVAQVTVATP